MNKLIQKSFTPPSGRRREKGSALITLLFFAVIISLAAGNIADMARRQLHLSSLIIDRTGAQQIAEGAAHQALAYVAQNQDNIGFLPSHLRNGDMGNGQYDVEIELSGDDYFSITSTGTVRDQSRTVRVHARAPTEGLAFAYALFSNGVIDGAGTGEVSGGDTGEGNIHANQDIIITGSAFISGNATASGTIVGSDNIGGSVSEGQPPISYPQLDLEHYRQIAEDNNQIHDGDLDLSSSRTPPGGVLWVNGDVHVGGGGRNNPATFTGLLIATGDIKQASHYRHYQKDDLPSMISRDGNIHLSGQTQHLEGLVYTGSGRIKFSGGSGFRGAIMAWDKIDLKGNWDVVEYDLQEPELEEGDERIQVLAWEM